MGSRAARAGWSARIVPAVALAVMAGSLSVAAVWSPAGAAEDSKPQRRDLDFSSEFSDSPAARSQGASALAEALAQARSTGERVPVEEAATETELVWANPDGTVSTELSQSPVRVRNDKGDLVDVDLTLLPAGDRLAPVAAPGEVSLSATGRGALGRVDVAEKEWFEIGYGESVGTPTVEGSRATYELPERKPAAEPAETPTAAAEASPGNGGASTDPAPTSDAGAAKTSGSGESPSAAHAESSTGSTTPSSAPAAESSDEAQAAAPAETAEPDVLEMRAMTEGVGARVLLAQAPAEAPTYEFPLRLSGLRASLTKDESASRLELRDGSGDVAASSSPLLMWDDSRDAGGDPTTMVPVAAELVAPEPGSSADMVLRLRPDIGFLTDPATTYPVTIDPDVTIDGPNTDTYVDEGAPNAAHWQLHNLRVGSEDGNNRKRIFTHWPIDQFMGKSVTDASLSLYQHYAYNCASRPTNSNPVQYPSNWPDPTTWSNQFPGWLGEQYKGESSFNQGNGSLGVPATGSTWTSPLRCRATPPASSPAPMSPRTARSTTSASSSCAPRTRPASCTRSGSARRTGTTCRPISAGSSSVCRS